MLFVKVRNLSNLFFDENVVLTIYVNFPFNSSIAYKRVLLTFKRGPMSTHRVLTGYGR